MAITSKGLQQLGFKSGIDYSLEDDGSGVKVIWSSSQPQPSEAEIESAHNEWSNDYGRLRKAEYPSIDELIVALWENVVEERAASVVSLESKRQAIKEKYPK